MDTAAWGTCHLKDQPNQTETEIGHTISTQVTGMLELRMCDLLDRHGAGRGVDDLNGYAQYVHVMDET